MSIDKEYRPEQVEKRWVREWEEQGLFRGDPDSGKSPFCIVIPPPNVTGNLHIGHVLVYTLHDIVSRWQRMQGRDMLWLPGTDHAGIATQNVVERQLADEGTSRLEIGREAFEKRAWEWKETYGNRITTALRTLGSSCDWTRERFTLDEGLSRAVREVFVRLYRDGLIYRGRYIVNWCPRCRTAISDLETEHETTRGKLYRIRYPAAGEAGRDLEVATTRPETMLGDTGVAVHPDDERYRGVVGSEVEVPLTGRTVPVVADSFVDPEFGTGAVKLTPGHDPNDFEAGRRLGLSELVVIDFEGKMTGEVGDYAGMDRFAARKRIVADLKKQGHLLGVEDHEHAVGHCQRCGTVIEPLVSQQWFVRTEELARPAIEAVESGRTRFVPATWSKVYFEWMRNIHDWCISRQLWWGHRIPAWHCDPCGETFVATEAPAACEKCGGELRQDQDVLDTWFSSGLWPFSTLGWPEQTRDLQHYYPTQLLITGHDIIFFWVARMMMMGLRFMDDVPFETVYIHGLVRDAHGQKMSKSKGNTVDPREVQDRYGTDAVRLTMAMLAAPGNDIPLAPERMEGYRAFANKLWNATRFVLMKVGDEPPRPYEFDSLTLADRWILSRYQDTVTEVQRGFEDYRFDRAADVLYHFVWGQFCDWYVECSKPAFQGDDASEQAGRRREATRSVLIEILGGILRLLHPIMPFITEELWQKLPGAEGYLAVAEWPESDSTRRSEQVEADMETLQAVIVQIRHLRAESNIAPSTRIDVKVATEDGRLARLIDGQGDLIALLARCGTIERVDGIADGLIAARGVVPGIQIAIPLEGVLDLDAERSRIDRELAKLDKELAGRSRKLANVSFLERAPAEVVEKERTLQRELLDRQERLRQHLAALGGSA